VSGHLLERRQVVSADLEEVFAFFAEPANLEAITPPWLNFEIVSATGARVRVGTELEYRLRWQGMPMSWRSRISEYERNAHFADEMLRGPYARWYHLHLFEARPGGVEMVDRIEYELPLGPLGRLVHRLVVGPQLEAIFDYRRDTIARIFQGEGFAANPA
jgi:hypothetical protein